MSTIASDPTILAQQPGDAPEPPPAPAPPPPPQKPVVTYDPGWFENIPAILKTLVQWVMWTYALRGLKWTKPPFQIGGTSAASDDSRTWACFKAVLQTFEQERTIWGGIGFVFNREDDFVGVDLDNCLNPDGTVKEWARPMVEALSDSYGEISPSGSGLKFWIRGSLPGPGTRVSGLGDDKTGAIEIYESGRYFTMTGRIFMADRRTIEDKCEYVRGLYNRLKPKETPTPSKTRRPSPVLSLDDEQLIAKAKAAKNGDKFARLFDGDISGYANDASVADAALCSKLTWWTGGDAERIDRIFRKSGLHREKWDEQRGHSTYGERTINFALTKWDGKHYGDGSNKKNGTAKPVPKNLGGDFSLDGKPMAKPETETPTEAAEPDWEAIAAEGADALASARIKYRPPLTNYKETDIGEGEEAKTIKEPLNIIEISQRITEVAGPWPKRVNELLFTQTSDYEPVYLGNANRLFAWCDEQTLIEWTRGGSFVTQERFFEHLRMSAQRYDAIETFPHFPPMPSIYYMHQPIPESPGGYLDQFVDRFTAATDSDKVLIRALVLTLFWGGTPGTRPAFLFTGDDDDREQGRGIGKTKTAEIIADGLVQGYLDISPTDEIADVKTRLLSGSNLTTRVARLDNVKTHKFSWADLESLITASEISGRALYVGEGRRPNTLTFLITLNGASLSKDLSQRVVPIRLVRPSYKGNWEQETRQFAEDHRWEIISEVKGILEAEPGPLVPKTRWAPWERDVLSKCQGAEAAQRLFIERQGLMDDDAGEALIVQNYIEDQIKLASCDPEAACLFIPSGMIADWINTATNSRYPTNRASSYLNGLGIPYLRSSKKDGKAGWVWRGKDVPQTASAGWIYPPVQKTNPADFAHNNQFRYD